MKNLIPIILTIVAFVIFMVLLNRVDDVYESAVETGGLLVISVLQFSKLLLVEKIDRRTPVEVINLRIHPLEYLVIFIVSLQLHAMLYKWDATTDWPRTLIAFFILSVEIFRLFLLKKSDICKIFVKGDTLMVYDYMNYELMRLNMNVFKVKKFKTGFSFWSKSEKVYTAHIPKIQLGKKSLQLFLHNIERSLFRD